MAVSRITHVALAEHLHEALLVALKARAVEQTRDTDSVDRDADEADDEGALFADHDAVTPRGRGFFSYGEDERRSRRLDMRGPLDLDPGPIPMEEGRPGEQAIELRFGR